MKIEFVSKSKSKRDLGGWAGKTRAEGLGLRAEKTRAEGWGLKKQGRRKRVSYPEPNVFSP